MVELAIFPLKQNFLQRGSCNLWKLSSKSTIFQVRFVRKMNSNFSTEELDLSSQIYTESVPTVDKLTDTLQNKLPQLLQVSSILYFSYHKKYKVRLVVIDSVAALFRFEYTEKEAVERSKMLWRLVTPPC